MLGTYGQGTRTYAPGGRAITITWPAIIFAYYRDQVVRASWHGTLLEDKRDHAGTNYRRNRYYDPGTGRFTQEDPIGLAGGANSYGYAGGDPVSNGDPLGLYCEKKSVDRMVCKDVGPGDYRTMSDFLGGAAGAGAFATFQTAGLTQWSAGTCRGGFSHSQCSNIARRRAGLPTAPMPSAARSEPARRGGFNAATTSIRTARRRGLGWRVLSCRVQ